MEERVHHFAHLLVHRVTSRVGKLPHLLRLRNVRHGHDKHLHDERDSGVGASARALLGDLHHLRLVHHLPVALLEDVDRASHVDDAHGHAVAAASALVVRHGAADEIPHEELVHVREVRVEEVHGVLEIDRAHGAGAEQVHPIFRFLQVLLELVQRLGRLGPPVDQDVLLLEVVDAESSELPLLQLAALHLHQRVFDARVDFLHHGAEEHRDAAAFLDAGDALVHAVFLLAHELLDLEHARVYVGQPRNPAHGVLADHLVQPLNAFVLLVDRRHDVLEPLDVGNPRVVGQEYVQGVLPADAVFGVRQPQLHHAVGLLRLRPPWKRVGAILCFRSLLLLVVVRLAVVSADFDPHA